MATIYDIAREAHVGIGTVSRVFNNHPSVSKATRERVLAVAGKMQYQPHPYARGLARKRTNSVLALVPFFSTFFFVEVLRGVQAKLSDYDSDLVLHGINHPDQVEASLRRNIARGRVDGVLFFSMRLPEEFIQHRLRASAPIVLVDTFHPQCDSITVDNARGGYLATRHLISAGHRRIGFLSANLESVPARERMQGYLHALREAGLHHDRSLVKATTSSILDGFTQESGYELMNQFLAMGRSRPTALFVSSDIQAAGALAAVADAGLRCPDDLAVIGFDDILLASHLGLSTMRQPMYQMGVLAIERLTHRMGNAGVAPEHTTYVPELIVRRTCGADTGATPRRTAGDVQRSNTKAQHPA